MSIKQINKRYKKITLGSQSPRRKELLKEMGLEFNQISIGADEGYSADLPTENVAEYLAEKKASFYATKLTPDELLITADTTVVFKNKLLEKPESNKHAFEILSQLSNNVHHVISGVCLQTTRNKVTFSGVTEVQFKALNTDEIKYYIENGNPMDKAGAYGIQEWIGKIGIKKINGCYYNVMGLPTPLLYDHLHELTKL